MLSDLVTHMEVLGSQLLKEMFFIVLVSCFVVYEFFSVLFWDKDIYSIHQFKIRKYLKNDMEMSKELNKFW